MSYDQPAPTSAPFAILAVCTANVCRSPAVERLLAAAFGPSSGVLVASAGLSAVIGAPMPDQMASLVRKAGVSPEEFAARQLTEQMLHDADLVLGMTKTHRAQIVGVYPPVVRRTFTLRELARLARGVRRPELPEGTPAERLAALLPLTSAQRGLRAVPYGEDDVVDPYRGSDALYRQSFDQLWPAIAEIARVVRP